MDSVKRVTDIVLGTSRARRVLSATIVLAIVITLPFCYDQRAYLFSIIGGSAGAAGAVSIYKYLYICVHILC